VERRNYEIRKMDSSGGGKLWDYPQKRKGIKTQQEVVWDCTRQKKGSNQRRAYGVRPGGNTNRSPCLTYDNSKGPNFRTSNEGSYQVKKGSRGLKRIPKDKAEYKGKQSESACRVIERLNERKNHLAKELPIRKKRGGGQTIIEQ